MSSIKYFILGVLLLSLQSTLVHFLAIGGAQPDLCFIFIVYAALRHGPLAGLATGFLMGLVQDVYSYETLGAGALAKSVLGYVLGLMEDHVVQLDLSSKIILLGVSFFIHDLIFVFAAGFSSDSITKVFLAKSLPEGIYTLFAGALFFYLFPSSKRHA